MTEPTTLGLSATPILIVLWKLFWKKVTRRTTLKVWLTITRTRENTEVKANIVNQSQSNQFIGKCTVYSYVKRNCWQKIWFLWKRRKSGIRYGFRLLQRHIAGCYSCIIEHTNKVEVGQKVNLKYFENTLFKSYAGLAILEVETSLGERVYSKPFEIRELRHDRSGE